MRQRVVIVGMFVILAAALVFAFNPARSALSLANRGGDEACITRVRTLEDVEDLKQDDREKLKKHGLSPDSFDPGFLAAEEVISCPER